LSKRSIVGTYFSAPYSAGGQPDAQVKDSFKVDLKTNTVQTLPIPR